MKRNRARLEAAAESLNTQLVEQLGSDVVLTVAFNEPKNQLLVYLKRRVPAGTIPTSHRRFVVESHYVGRVRPAKV